MGRRSIEDVFSLFREAADFHARLLRMPPKEDGGARGDVRKLDALVTAAEKLKVVNSFTYSARGVVFMQQRRAILEGSRPLKQIEAESAAGYIAHQARKTCGF